MLVLVLVLASVGQPAPLRGVDHRPVYHLISQGAEAGWLSDPNGPIFVKGRYHMFYQGATAAEMRSHTQPFHTPDPVSWGHMSSLDLTHWVQHPRAIAPAAPGSYEGADVYSGAMILDPTTGTVKAFFACGCGGARPPGGRNDAVCYAESNDPNLTEWTKYDGEHGSVVLYIPEALGDDKTEFLPEAGSQFIFRNATDGNWIMMVGSGRSRAGPGSGVEMTVLLFSAPDLEPASNWTYRGPMYTGGGPGGAWCPYIAGIDPGDPTAVVLDMQNWVGRGTVSPPHYRFVPAVQQPQQQQPQQQQPQQQQPQQPLWPLLDQGTAHVSAVFVGDEPKNRSSIVMRWLTGAPSCNVIPGKMAAAPCKEPDATFVDWGWVGAHSLPITIGRAAGPVQNSQGLSYAVVEEVEQLRIPGSHTVSPTAPTANAAANAANTAAELTGPTGFTAGSGPGDHKVANPTPPPTLIPTATWHIGASGVAVELLVNVTLPAPGVPCSAGLRIRATEDGTEQTTVALWSSTRVDLVVNRSLSSTSSNQTKSPQEAAMPDAMMGRTTTLRVFVDHSVIEIFVGDFAIMSTRVYPMAGNAADRVGTFSDGGCKLGALESWQMEDVYAGSSTAT